ncbi:MAG: NAD(P)H-dependent oxidoreductase [Actinobacteria bacterium]|nr:NAD(P)H-dependent oxidoreductase [Actinomycetota bacterium]
MQITILSGSPKGDMSVTLQYMKYIESNCKENEYKVFHVGQEIKRIEKDTRLFEEIVDGVSNSDGVVWCTPVYYFLIPSQMKRFIELIYERGVGLAFSGKYAAILTTSVHCSDHTAHDYLRSICEDLGMRYVDGYSADMHDLLHSEERERLVKFAACFFKYIAEDKPTCSVFLPLRYKQPEYVPGEIEDVPKTWGRKIVLISDADDHDYNLNHMIDVFTKSIASEVEVVKLNEIDIRGGCLGCYRCAYDTICVQKDEVMDTYRQKIFPADAIVYAAAIKDRFLSSRWKMFLDRAFFSQHSPPFQGGQILFLISGPLRQVPNLRQWLLTFSECSGASLAGIITDEYEDSAYVTKLIGSHADQLVWAIDERYAVPGTFLGVGVHKVMRDCVYDYKSLFKYDNDFYKEHHLYDFPQKNVGLRAQNLFISLALKNPALRNRVYRDFTKQLVRPLQKVLQG